MKAVLALAAVLLVLQNRIVSANRYIPAIAADLFEATFNPSGFSVTPSGDGCINAFTSSVRWDIADTASDIRHALEIHETAALANNGNFVQLEEKFVININYCAAHGTHNAKYDCYVSEIYDTVRVVKPLNHNHILVDRRNILFCLEKLTSRLAIEFGKLKVCLLGNPEVTSPEPQSSSDSPTSSLSTEAEYTETSDSSDETTEAPSINP
ncbi:uncharacterized protein [Bactrocera oleae]|uniref:uncharacterized protein n=1 Tax=Bactrocera oleae TaxID=104688 RepID=UPI00387E28B6